MAESLVSTSFVGNLLARSRGWILQASPGGQAQRDLKARMGLRQTAKTLVIFRDGGRRWSEGGLRKVSVRL